MLRIAVSRNGMALMYASLELRADRDMVTIAVCENGLAIHYASEELRTDYDVAMKARLCTGKMLVRQNYLPPPRRRNSCRFREGYGRYDILVFSRIRVSTVGTWGPRARFCARAVVVDSFPLPEMFEP